MSSQLRSLLRWVQQLALGLLAVLMPKKSLAVVHGYPFTEGNAVEVVRGLVRHYGGQVVWLVENPQATKTWLGSCAIELPDVRLVRHRSWHGMYAYTRAEVIFFTHGLYGSPLRSRRTKIVNLWHGDGVKAHSLSKEGGGPRYPADFLVRSTTWTNAIRAVELGMPQEDMIVSGNPRVDQFFESRSPDLEKIAISNDRPFVLWMPTFRKSRDIGLTAGNVDIRGPVEQNDELRGLMQQATDRLGARGITLLVKPHPLDKETFNTPGLTVVSNEQLAAAGVQLYELMGRAAGLITDYSSTWVDYLVLDRPIGFVVPDEAEYVRGRGLVLSDALEWLPGPRLNATEDFDEFAGAVLGTDEDGRVRRAAVRAHIGLSPRGSVTDFLLEDLHRRGVFRRGSWRDAPGPDYQLECPGE